MSSNTFATGRSIKALARAAAVLLPLVPFFLCLGADEPKQGKKAKEPNPFPRPAKAGGPRHDAPDIPFRRAPMNAATRSVVIPLATNLHLAFDTELLRTHTVWNGGPLNLWGAVYHGGKDRYFCDFDGTALWSQPPVMPWTSRTVGEQGFANATPSASFKGISTKGGVTTLMYELRLPEGKTVRIHESARLRPGLPANVVERRFEIGPSPRSLTLLAHAERGQFLTNQTNVAALFIDRGSNVLVTAARGTANLKLERAVEPADYEVTRWFENKGDSAYERQRATGSEARCYVRIPLHTNAITVEVLTIVAPSLAEAERQLREFPKSEITPPDIGFLLSNAPDTNAPGLLQFSSVRTNEPLGGDEYFRIERFQLPKAVELLVTGMDFMPDGNLAIATWLGDVWIVEKPIGALTAVKYRRFARGLCEPGGLKVFNRMIYVVQKCELTRLIDTDGNGEADWFECVSQDWGFTGNYHDFSFGPVPDLVGNLHVYRNGNHGIWEVPYMGWDLAIAPATGKAIPYCSGFRSPDGFGSFGPAGDLFMTDNQGNWIGACTLTHLQRGRFYGFPSATPAPKEDFNGRKDFSPPAVWFPYKMVKSASGMAEIKDNRFGPFRGQLLVGDFQNAIVTRVMLEKVQGEWQGAVWPMLKGFGSGVNRLAFGPDGKLYVGGLKNAAWAAVAPKEQSLERVSYTGKVPFEVREVHARPAGFELIFTQPVDPATAGNADSYDVAQYGYLYHKEYGSPEIDHDGKKDSATPIKVTKAVVSENKLKVELTLEGWKTGYVTLVRGLDVKSAEGKPLWHDTFYYTLNKLPK